MSLQRWTPHVTVAAIIEREGRFLIVEEQIPDGLRLNNPAGHLEPGESPQQAVVREALEETARDFVPTHLLGVYLSRYHRPAVDGREAADMTFVRFAYVGTVGEPLPGRALDEGIVRTLWLSADELRACPGRHRSPLLMRCVEDHLAGRRLPLDAVQAHASIYLGPQVSS